jgi:ribosomal protein S12 methylthiotransferase
MRKIHLTSMGCVKNLVDSEVLLGQLDLCSSQITHNPEEADILLINTCGFIQDAKQESIQAIFEAVQLKEKDKHKQVFVIGCLSQRYRDELLKEIPEIDAVFGTEDYKKILDQLGEDDFHAEDMYKTRLLTTPKHFAYLKISEGCNHTCAFCTIPGIRGKHRSRTIEDIVSEANLLATKGVKELILVSQDTSYYGRDLYQKSRIIDLLNELAHADLFRWIRPLYWYPSNFPMEYIELMNRYDSIIPYLDMPIQHASDRVLKYMRRAETQKSLRQMYKFIRKEQPNICLRTTLILGHPGENEKDFKQLKDFVQEIRFDRLGTFVYSDEKGTPAHSISSKVPKNIAKQRKEEIMAIQQSISEAKNQEMVASIQTVLIDRYNFEENYYIGRTFKDAPEIDNEIIIRADTYKSEWIGSFKQACITDASEYELYAKLCVI